MTKKAVTAGYEHVTPQHIERLESVIEESKSHTYSVSRVYNIYNELLKKNDPHQSCASCLASRVTELEKWYEGYKSGKALKPGDVPQSTGFKGKDDVMYATQEEATASFNPVTQSTQGDGNPAKFAGFEGAEFDTEEEAQASLPAPTKPTSTTYYLNDEVKTAVSFTPNADDQTKGVIVYDNEDRKAVKPGTYTTEGGAIIAVQPGGKASIKEDLT